MIAPAIVESKFNRMSLLRTLFVEEILRWNAGPTFAVDRPQGTLSSRIRKS